jgi:hypothetical protein
MAYFEIYVKTSIGLFNKDSLALAIEEFNAKEGWGYLEVVHSSANPDKCAN